MNMEIEMSKIESWERAVDMLLHGWWLIAAITMAMAGGVFGNAMCHWIASTR